ncbi:MAG: prolipoprotein diacylglyceryl transferase family protein [Hymenobacter sp.]
MNSEIVGKPTDVPWAFVFPLDTEHLQAPLTPLPGAVLVQRSRLAYGEEHTEVLPAGTAPTPTMEMAVPRHPTQIYESLFCVFLLVLLYAACGISTRSTRRARLARWGCSWCCSLPSVF